MSWNSVLGGCYYEDFASLLGFSFQADSTQLLCNEENCSELVGLEVCNQAGWNAPAVLMRERQHRVAARWPLHPALLVRGHFVVSIFCS